MARATTVQGRINGTTNAYLGNNRSRDISVRGNKFASHEQNYRNIRRGLGMSAGQGGKVCLMPVNGEL